MRNWSPFIIANKYRKTEIEVIRNVLDIRNVIQLGAVERQERFFLRNESAVELELTDLETLWTTHADDRVACMVKRDCDVPANCYVERKINFAFGGVVESEEKSKLISKRFEETIAHLIRS